MSLESMARPQAAGQNHLGHQQRILLGRLFERRRYPKKAVILRRGEHCHVVFVVCRGTIQLSTENGRGYSIVINRGEGDFFGEELLLGRGRSPYQATALVDCELHLLDRSDLDEIGAQAPGILVKIMQSVARRLRSNARLCRDRSRRDIRDDPLWDRASFETRAARFLVSARGSRMTVAFILIAAVAWGFFGHHGIPWFHLDAFDPRPFKTLTLIFKLIAAFSTPLFLLLLLRIARLNDLEARSQVKLLQEFAGVEDVLGRYEKRMRERPVGETAIPDHENAI